MKGVDRCCARRSSRMGLARLGALTRPQAASGRKAPWVDAQLAPFRIPQIRYVRDA